METNQQNQPKQPINIFAQIAKGLETTNMNVVDLFRLVEELALTIKEQKEKTDAIYSALFPKPQEDTSEPNADGAETINE